LRRKKEEIAVVEDILLSQRGRAKILPAGWPIRQGYFSSGFGMRGKRMHKGADLVTKSGSNIYAVEDGEVTFSGQMRGYGNLIEIKHGNTYSTRYGHNSRNMVKVGDRVKKGQIIGLVGATGRATTAHVHFELLRNGSAINPMKFLAAINSFQLAQK
jgi:murein DD-endopeptidase MepM/ murein hydrolase activator NlpD